MRAFPKQSELWKDISNEICEEKEPERGANSEIRHYLDIIGYRLRVCNAPEYMDIGTYLRGVSLSLNSAIFDAGRMFISHFCYLPVR